MTVAKFMMADFTIFSSFYLSFLLSFFFLTLILSIHQYFSSFNSVHYPLPLKYDANPDPSVLRETITRLRLELDQAKAALHVNHTSPISPIFDQRDRSTNEPSLAKLKAENYKLQEENKQLRILVQREISGENSEKRATEIHREVSTRLEQIRQQWHEREGELLVTIETFESEIRNLKAEIAQKEKEIRKLSSQVKEFASSDSIRVVELEKQLWEAQDRLDVEKQENEQTRAQMNHEIRRLQEENRILLDSEQKLKVKCRNLTSELDKLKAEKARMKSALPKHQPAVPVSRTASFSSRLSSGSNSRKATPQRVTPNSKTRSYPRSGQISGQESRPAIPAKRNLASASPSSGADVFSRLTQNRPGTRSCFTLHSSLFTLHSSLLTVDSSHPSF